MDLVLESNKLLEMGLRLKEKIIKVLDEMPENPKIHRLAEGCFILSLRDLNNNWTPELQDNRAQAKLLKEIVNLTEFEKIREVLLTVVERGWIIHNGKHRFNQQVRDFVKERFFS